MTKSTRVRLYAASILLLASILAGLASAAPGEDSAAQPAERSYLGEQACRACHALEAVHWDETRHADVFRAQARRTSGSAKDKLAAHTCEASSNDKRAETPPVSTRTGTGGRLMMRRDLQQRVELF